MNSKNLEKIKELLIRDYPEVKTPLLHDSAFTLLIATMMSAQTLDETTNKVTPSLFQKYPDVYAFAKADPEEIARYIKLVNYYKTKSRNIVKLAQKLIEDFDGVVPHTIDELTLLPGIGRKTANVVISEWFARNSGEKILPEGFVVDTHVKRVAKRLGWTTHDDPEKVELDLMKIFPREEWDTWSLRMIFHGRYRCKAKNPQCFKDPEWSKVCGCVSEVKI